MKSVIALLPGDGIGTDVVEQGRMVLEAVAKRFGHEFSFPSYLVGGCAIDEAGDPLPPATLQGVQAADAILMGAVGGPAWDNLPGNKRPEKGLLALRSGLEVFANLRPAVLAPSLREACPLKDSVLTASSADGSPSFDLLIVRELTGGIYFGQRGRSADGESAFDTETYSVAEIQRLLKVGFEAARGRRRKLCVVDKANVLESSRLWRETAKRIAPDYPEVELDFMYVDNCAMQLIRAPGRFDVIATSNIFGDILSDEASVLTGSIGMLPSASLGSVLNSSGLPRGLYEPIHGSAPDIAGKNLANPLGTILSAAMLLRHSFGLVEEAAAVEAAVFSALGAGYRTADLASASTPVEMRVGTKEMGVLVLASLLRPVPKTA